MPNLTTVNKILIILALSVLPNFSASSHFPCTGKMINPITDICWSCLLPISIGNTKVARGWGVKNRDTNNPSSPLCLCTKANIPIPGVSIGFWEPVRLVDVTRTPFCMVNLGGIQMQNHRQTKVSSYQRGYGKHHSHHSFYHVHYYIYPVIYWLELITDFLCLEEAAFDVAYLSEYDITWNDEKLQMLMHPESFLFGNPIAQSACSVDCAAATTNLPIDSLFWCAGCLGNIYPFSGANADHVGGIQNSSLLTARLLAKMHRSGLLEETSTSDGSPNGKLCRKNLHFLPKKSQYKLQLTNPVSTSGNLGCWPLGLSDIFYSPFKEYPGNGQDFGYLIWRKRNCCLL